MKADKFLNKIKKLMVIIYNKALTKLSTNTLSEIYFLFQTKNNLKNTGELKKVKHFLKPYALFELKIYISLI